MSATAMYSNQLKYKRVVRLDSLLHAVVNNPIKAYGTAVASLVIPAAVDNSIFVTSLVVRPITDGVLTITDGSDLILSQSMIAGEKYPFILKGLLGEFRGDDGKVLTIAITTTMDIAFMGCYA